MNKRTKSMSADNSQSEASIRAPIHSRLLDLKGLGKEVWLGVDAQEYVNGLREERDLPESAAQ